MRTSINQRDQRPLAVLGLILLAALAAIGAAPVSAPQAETPQAAARARIRESIEALEAWLPKLDHERKLDRIRKNWLHGHLQTLTTALEWVPSELIPVAGALVDIASYRLSRLPNASYFLGGGTTYSIRKQGLRALRLIEEDGHREQLVDWLARGVLAEPEFNADNRRWLALFLLLPRQSELIDEILLRIAGDSDDPLSSEVNSQLAFRTGPTVDAFIVAQLDAPRILGTPHPHNLLRQRLELGPLDRTAAGLLVQHIKGLLLDADWRVASRGIELCRNLDPQRSAPMLVEALFTWRNRNEHDVGHARRMTWDLVSALRDLSGRSIGDNPRGWMTWWNAVREGRAQFASDDHEQEARPESTSNFFGLRPITDRITFIIDHSGSMNLGWMSSKYSRYSQAIEQLIRFLQATGEETLFNIILFNDAPLVSSPHLVQATARNLERAQGSLNSRSPDGGTYLRGAVEAALKLDSEGNTDPERLQIDTIVVLCDGDTNSGPGWVRPLLKRVNDDLRLVIHCVQIGSGGDGTLEELARLTGGDFIRIDG